MPVLGKLVRKKFSAQNIFDSKEATVDQQLKFFFFFFYQFVLELFDPYPHYIKAWCSQTELAILIESQTKCNLLLAGGENHNLSPGLYTADI